MRSAGNFHSEWGYLAPAPSFMRSVRVAVVATAVGATAGAGIVVSLVERPAADAGDTSIARHALVTSVPAATPQAASASPANKPAVAQAQAPMQAQAQTPMQAQAQTPMQAQTQPPMQAQAQAPMQAQTQPPMQAQTPPAVESEMSSPPTGGPARSVGASEASTAPQAPASVAALAEVPPATEALSTQAMDDATVAPDPAPARKKAIKKHRSVENDAVRRWQANGGDARKKSTSSDRGLGSLLRRFFSARAGSSSFPN